MYVYDDAYRHVTLVALGIAAKIGINIQSPNSLYKNNVSA